MTRPAGAPTRSGPLVAALDVGGTDIKAVLADGEEIILEQIRPTRADQGPQAATAAVIEAARDVISAAPATTEVVAVGLCAPGTVDEARGMVTYSENVGWRDEPLRDLVAEATGLPVGFGHDVRTGCLAEWRIGAGRGATDMAYVSIGTGIAASLVLGGRIYSGKGWAGELGHGDFQDGAPCTCGGKGCLETFASAAGIARVYRERTGAGVSDVPGSAEVLHRAEAGDGVAREAWDSAMDSLGRMIAQIVRVVAVPTVVIGGGIVRAGAALLDPIEAATKAWLTFHPAPRIVPASLGSAAGAQGAALLAYDALAEARATQEPVSAGHRSTAFRGMGRYR